MSQHPIQIIGLTGLAGSGKDTVREILQGYHRFAGLALADPIRAMLRQLLQHSAIDTKWMDQRELKEATIPELGVSYRQLAQTLGTEWGRAVAPDLWIRIAQRHIDLWRRIGDAGVVISDIRFPNEADWVRSQGGQIWRIHRPDIARVRDHDSERGVDAITADYVIYNTNTLEHLAKVVAATLRYEGQVSA